MKSYRVPYITTVKPARHLSRTEFDSSALFNVRIDGVDVSSGVTRAAASHVMATRPKPSFCQIYLSDTPLEGRKAAWKKAGLPKPYKMLKGVPQL